MQKPPSDLEQSQIQDLLDQKIKEVYIDASHDQDVYYNKGYVKLQIVSAKYFNEGRKWFGQCNSFVHFDYRGTCCKTVTSTGTEPIWAQVFDIYVDDLRDELLFKFVDDEMSGERAIGLCNVKFSSLCINGGEE